MVIALVAASAAVLGLIRSQTSTSADTGKLSATQRVEQSPPPALFPDTDVSGWTTRLAEQKRAADVLFFQGWTRHGTTRDDEAFIRWVAKRIPAPSSADKRAAELRKVGKLARAHTAAGRKAATWLVAHGKQDIWQLYLHDQRELLPRAEGRLTKTQLDAALKMAGTINSRLAAHYKQASPSYPSGHATSSSAAVTVLSGFAPHRAADYRWMQGEVAYALVYMSRHLPSDILAGALLGDLIGDYVLYTSSHTWSPPASAHR